MSVTSRTIEPIGNPARRDLLLRSLRSNLNATIFTMWTILVCAVGIIVLINQLGLGRLFDAHDADPTAVGRAVAQWWIITITIGIAVFSAVSTVTGCVSKGGRERLHGWSMTLVPPWRVVMGIFQAQLAAITLALLLALPVAGIALAMGGTSIAQLAVGLGGALLSGSATSMLGAAVACRSNHVFRPLTVTLLVVVALFAVPFGLHQSRTGVGSDPVLAVIPIVAVSDAASPRVIGATTRTGAADAPVDHLAATVSPWDGLIPPWGWGAGGAAFVTLAGLLVTRLRIARPFHR